VSPLPRSAGSIPPFAIFGRQVDGAVPGAYHCSAGPTPVKADYLTQLMGWMEDGKTPGSVNVTFETGPKDPTVTRALSVAPYTPAASPAADRTAWLGLASYRPEQQTWCRWEGPSLVCDNRSPN
jgi:hypothetical protein